MQLVPKRFMTNKSAVILAAVGLLCTGMLAGKARPGMRGAAGREVAASTNADARLRRVEEIAVELPGGAGESPLRLSLAELMNTYNVPGLSIAVIEHYKIVDAKAYGVIAPGSSTAVTTKTLFQAGSISKPVAATGALYLVEHGKLLLDEEVNRTLTSWKLPENEFTQTQKLRCGG